MGPRLLQELFYLIIDLISNDLRTLQSLTLVSRDFLFYARQYIIGGTAASPIELCGPRGLAFVKMLQTSTINFLSFDHLHIRDSQGKTLGAAATCISSDVLILISKKKIPVRNMSLICYQAPKFPDGVGPKFPSVTVLSIRHLDPTDDDHTLIRLISCFPKIERLCLSLCTSWSIQQIHPQWKLSPYLQHLTIRITERRGILHWIFRQDLPRLEKLELYLHHRREGIGGSLEGLVEYLQRRGAGITHLGLLVGSYISKMSELIFSTRATTFTTAFLSSPHGSHRDRPHPGSTARCQATCAAPTLRLSQRLNDHSSLPTSTPAFPMRLLSTMEPQRGAARVHTHVLLKCVRANRALSRSLNPTVERGTCLD